MKRKWSRFLCWLTHHQKYLTDNGEKLICRRCGRGWLTVKGVDRVIRESPMRDLIEAQLYAECPLLVRLKNHANSKS